MRSMFERIDSMSFPARVATLSAMAGVAILGLRTVDADGVDHRVYSNNIFDTVTCSGHEGTQLEAGTPLQSLADKKGYDGSLAYIYTRDSIHQIGKDNIGSDSNGNLIVTKDTLADLAESCS